MSSYLKSMQKIAQHKILASGDSYEESCRQVRRHFSLTKLVIYDYVEVIEKESRCAGDDDFFEVLHNAEQQNRKNVDSLVQELQETGARSIDDLRKLEHGYPSKVLHVLTHFLDGFIGIDSYFYSLVDDSHWLPRQTLETMRTAGENFWLIHIDCYSATPEEASLVRM